MNQVHPHTLRIGIGHLFATGSNPSRDSIFHIACTCYTADTPPETKQWVLNPGRKITKRLYQKSRVSTENCSQAPRWDDEGPLHITPFFADLDILFVFSLENEIRWFQEGVLKTAKTPPVCVDLFEMAQFFLPDQALYSADALLDQTLGAGTWQRSAHRLPYLIRGFQAVLKDIITTIRSKPFVFALLKQAVKPSNTPIEFSAIYEMARQAAQIKWSTDLFAQTFPRPTTHASGIQDAKQLTQEIQAFLPANTPANQQRQEERSEPKPITPAHIDQGFETLAVTTNRRIQPRPAQREYAKACAKALNEGGLYALEAGTGTGKTLGYLLPLCELLRQAPGCRVLIATATKNLQDQIFEQEIPRLTSGKTLYQHIRAAVLKGKANYMCITALTDLYEDVYIKETQNAGERLAWLYLYMVLLRKNGEIEGIPRILKDRFDRLPEFVEEVNAQMACMPGLCRVGNDCIYPQRLREAGAADIVITNQHKLASVESSLVLNAAACLIDEADQFPENFRSAVRRQLPAYQIRRRFIRRLVGSKKRKGYAQILDERFHNEGDLATGPNADILNTCLNAIKTVLSECAQMETTLHRIAAVPHLHHDTEARWLDLTPMDAGTQLQKQLKLLANQFERIGTALGRILSSGRYRLLRQPEETKKTRFLRKEKTRIEKYQNLTRDFMRDAREIAADYPSDAFVHIFEKRGLEWTLSKVPYDIKDALDGILFRPISTVLFTSASLFVQRRLDLFARELFLEQPFTDTLHLRSPFDFDANVFGAVTTFVPRFDYKAARPAKEQWQNTVARTIAALVVATYGRTLVLFTNAREMKKVFNRVRPILQAHDIDPVLQDGSSLAEIQAFRLTEHSALFGVNRFWTGVDFPGPTLSQVIVVRVPNPSLGNPLIRHRLDQMGEAFWEHYYRPYTSLRLKQGFGRLIRSEKDRGLFVVLDQRLVTDLRMQPLKEELPIPLHSFYQEWNRTHQGDLQDLITKGLKKLKLYQEFVERDIDVYKLDEASVL